MQYAHTRTRSSLPPSLPPSLPSLQGTNDTPVHIQTHKPSSRRLDIHIIPSFQSSLRFRSRSNPPPLPLHSLPHRATHLFGLWAGATDFLPTLSQLGWLRLDGCGCIGSHDVAKVLVAVPVDGCGLQGQGGSEESDVSQGTSCLPWHFGGGGLLCVSSTPTNKQSHSTPRKACTSCVWGRLLCSPE